MNETISTYREEIADITSLLTQYLKQTDNTHYKVRGAAYSQQPFISVITTDIDYFDGTTLSQLVEIVEKNHQKSWYTYSISGTKIIVTTESGTMMDAYGMMLTIHFYEHLKNSI